MTTGQLDCAYRFASDGEIYKGKFDIESGRIIGFEDYMTDRCKKAVMLGDFCEKNYSTEYQEEKLAMSDLCDALLRHEDALVVINYNNVGVIKVGRTDVSILLKMTGWMTKGYLINESGDVYTVEPTAFAVIKAPVYTVESTQPLMHAYAFESGDSGLVMTRFGLIRCTKELLNFKPTMKGYARLFTPVPNGYKDYYGLFSDGNKVKYLVINNSSRLEVIDDGN